MVTVKYFTVTHRHLSPTPVLLLCVLLSANAWLSRKGALQEHVGAKPLYAIALLLH